MDAAVTIPVQTQREQLAHQAVDRLTSPVVIVARDGRVLFWNQAAEQTFGYRPTEAEGRPLDALILSPTSNGEQAAALTEAAQSGNGFFVAEYRTKTGRIVALAVAVDAVSDHNGSAPTCFVLTSRPLSAMRQLAATPQSRQELDGLTMRQREVLELIAEGWSTRHIAQKLKLSVKTVETHRAHLMQRLRVDSVARLVRYAVAVGLVPPTP